LEDIVRDLISSSTRITELLTLCARVHRGLLAPRLAELGLSPGEELVLVALRRADGATHGELARALALRPPTVTAVLRTMERNGLLERRGDPHDGRVVRSHLTRRGRRLSRELDGDWSASERELLSGLSERELATLERLLTRIAARRG
jgi:DNA-binding MarR family transcriptional regulator